MHAWETNTSYTHFQIRSKYDEFVIQMMKQFNKEKVFHLP